VGCGPEATKDKFSCSSLNTFKEIRVSSRTVIKNNISIIKDGQNIYTMKYKSECLGRKFLILFNALIIDIALWCRVEMCKCQVRDRWKTSPRWLWEAVSVSAWLQNHSGGWIDGLFVMVRTSNDIFNRGIAW